MALACCLTAPLAAGALPAFVCTEARQPAPRGQAAAGSRLMLVSPAGRRSLAPGFFVSADACVSFDARQVLFAGRRTARDPWQIWELELGGGTLRRVTAFQEDAVRPVYLPGGRIAYARRTPDGFQIETAPLAGGEPERITFSPGDHLPAEVLRDGRILFEAPQRDGRDLYTVYTDGSGVETYRCDHGHDRYAARQLATGDLIFHDGARLGRFTSALARQVDVPLPAGEFAGPVAEAGPGEWLVSYRRDGHAPFAVYRWSPETGTLALAAAAAGGAHLLRPVTVAERPVPLRHPSALGNREGGNVLCLNAYTSRAPFAAGSVAAVRVYTAGEGGVSRLLGETRVEPDGSFFVQVPSERPLRFEVVDSARRVLQAERDWFWMRRGEQRVCVGCHAGPERAPENAVPAVLLRSDVPVRMLE